MAQIIRRCKVPVKRQDVTITNKHVSPRSIKNNYLKLILEHTFQVNRYILSPSRLNVVFDISRMLLLSK